jgi:metal-dependent amidase/aminoacylase/carboxypeptidase family protein
VLLGSFLWLSSALGAQAPPVGGLEHAIAECIEARREELIELRRDLHRYPELSGEEQRTAGIVAARLKELGFEVRTGVGGHGVVARLAGARPGPVVAFRADMDAVRSSDPDPVEFRSLVPGVRHICGHDLHTTIGVALAEGFAPARAELPGTLLFLFQPSEEDGRGARAMLAAGALGEPRPAAIYALHTAPFEVGELATAEHVLMAGRDRALIDVRGSGAVEEVARTLAEELRGLHTLAPGQELALVPLEARFLDVRAERSGPDRWRVLLQVSSGSRAARAEVRTAAEALTRDLARPDVQLELAYDERIVPGVENDPTLARAARARLGALLGPERTPLLTGVVPVFSEDFGFFQDEVPGVMFFLGVANQEKGWGGMPHSPGFVADEEALFVGARAMAAVLLDFLAGGAPR